jgi:archaellum component FlaF (FlaF/FlaG flagellin family)
MDIDKQYFANSQNYTSLMNTYALTIQYLLSQFFNLATEKRFTIKSKRSPLEITVTEYGSIGENESNYQLFIDSNQLTGNEILILQPGREVVIYV